MPARTPTLLLLALLVALVQPLCLCRADVLRARTTNGAESCCSRSNAPRRADPCGRTDGRCECERIVVLAEPVPMTSLVLDLELALAQPVLGLPSTCLATTSAPVEYPARAQADGGPPLPPGRPGQLPLRL